jgi:hypothetical protein
MPQRHVVIPGWKRARKLRIVTAPIGKFPVPFAMLLRLWYMQYVVP